MSTSTLATTPAALSGAWPAPRLSVRHACLAGALAIACWVVLAAWTNHSQLQDSLEQFVWGQSLEWGYWKHPPLTSWLMWAGLQAFGPVPWVTYVLGGLVTVFTMLCTTRLAQLLAGDRAAVLTALLLALHYGFTRRAQMFNHNTVLVACMALAAVATVVAVQRNRRRDWLLVGLAAGLALMAKYQAAVPLTGVLLAVVLSGQARRCLPGIVIASVCAAAVVLPHGLWALQHDLQTVGYAMSSLETGGHHPHRLRLVPVLAMQAKYFLTIGGFAAVLWAATRRRTGGRAAPSGSMTALQRHWFAGLVLLPMAVLVGAAATGVQVQSHWGFQASQFLVVPIAIVLHRRFGNWRRPHTVAWLAMQVVAMAVFVAESAEPPRAGQAPDVTRLPAAQIAREVEAHWRALGRGCPLRYLRGPVALAGMVSAYDGHRLQVLEDGDPAKSPWIDLEAMRASGFVDVRDDKRPHPTGYQAVVHLPGATPMQFVLEVHPPERACEPE